MERYEEIKTIGKGSFGRAVLVKRDDGQLLVLKQINVFEMSPKERSDAMNEVNLLAMLNHENIIGYHDSFILNGSLHIIMEYANAGDIHLEIKKRILKKKVFTESEILSWFAQICAAIQYINSKNILHRDLKTQNIFLTINSEGKYLVKLGDFGIAKILNSDTSFAKTVIGTPYYLSPEICEDLPYDHKSDIWSLGCVLYELTTLKHAFNANSLPALVLKILKGTYPPVPSIYSNDLKQLISSMLQTDPKLRPNIDEILQLPFIKPYIGLDLKPFSVDDEIVDKNCKNGNPQQSKKVPTNIPMAIAKSKAAAAKVSNGKNQTPSSTSSTTSSSKVTSPTITSTTASQQQTIFKTPTTPSIKKVPLTPSTLASKSITKPPPPPQTIITPKKPPQQPPPSNTTTNRSAKKPTTPTPTPILKRSPSNSNLSTPKRTAVTPTNRVGTKVTTTSKTISNSSSSTTKTTTTSISPKNPSPPQTPTSNELDSSSTTATTTTSTNKSTPTPVYSTPTRPTITMPTNPKSKSNPNMPNTSSLSTSSSSAITPKTTSSSSSSTRSLSQKSSSLSSIKTTPSTTTPNTPNSKISSTRPTTPSHRPTTPINTSTPSHRPTTPSHRPTTPINTSTPSHRPTTPSHRPTTPINTSTPPTNRPTTPINSSITSTTNNKSSSTPQLSKSSSSKSLNSSLSSLSISSSSTLTKPLTAPAATTSTSTSTPTVIHQIPKSTISQLPSTSSRSSIRNRTDLPNTTTTNTSTTTSTTKPPPESTSNNSKNVKSNSMTNLNSLKTSTDEIKLNSGNNSECSSPIQYSIKKQQTHEIDNKNQLSKSTTSLSRDKKLATRANALKHFCNSIFGDEIFQNAYSYLKELTLNDNGSDVIEDAMVDENNSNNDTQGKLKEIVGEKIYYIKYLQQLLYCESQLSID
eukprot:gene492-620_t